MVESVEKNSTTKIQDEDLLEINQVIQLMNNIWLVLNPHHVAHLLVIQ